MIDCLMGKLLEKTPELAVVGCGGVGYLARISTSAAGALPAVGEQCTLYTELRISENDITLYGFADKDSRQMFRMLTAISGVGPKAALSILGALSPQRIALAAAGADHKAFTVAPGVGPKLAQRIVLELKDKVGRAFAGGGVDAASLAAAPAPAGAMAQASAALVSLGYSGSEAAAALAGLDESLPVQELIRLALQGIGKRR